MTDSTSIVTLPESTKSTNSNSPVQVQIKPKSQSGFVPRETGKSEFLDSVDFGSVGICVISCGT